MMKLFVLLVISLCLAIDAQGRDGLPGLKGQQGETGFPGRAGLPGRDGLPGMAGLRGPPGDCEPSQCSKGEMGETGFPGRDGSPGIPGLDGKCSIEKCSRADKGEKGAVGQPGLPGVTGTRSKRDFLHLNGLVGGILLVRHSQSSEKSTCPDGMTKLWDGFSFGNGQDLGSAGSCLRRFTAVSRVYCSDDECDNLDQDDGSIWLSATKTSNAETISERISRCIVCETSSPIIAIHSQTVNIPDCPEDWTPLWNGYSFATHKSDHQNLDKSLISSGSCLQSFSPSLFIECHNNNETCRLMSNKLNYWLNADEESDSKAISSYPKISRCSVCLKSS